MVGLFNAGNECVNESYGAGEKMRGVGALMRRLTSFVDGSIVGQLM